MRMSNDTKIYPFKFLDAYTKEDKDIFFGREDEIAQLYEMLFQSDLILIYGASGTGKTSLIQCGLANKFKPFDWFPIPIRRKSNLNDSIAEALKEAIGSSTQNEDDDFERMFQQEADESISPLEKQLKEVYKQHFRPIYLIFDQFEELYVLGSKDEQAKFVQTVKEIMQIEQPIKILLSIREEYLGLLYEFERAVPELLRKKLRIEPMNLDKVRQVLEGIHQNPRTIVRLEEGKLAEITEVIFKKIQGEEKSLFIQLPYLQVFLDRLYRQITGDESFQKDALFDVASVQKIGDIGNVLRDFLEEQVLRIAKDLKQKDETIWKILSPFATLEGTKEPLSLASLAEKLPQFSATLLSQTVSKFVDARILRYTEKDELYEVSHDTLAKQIAAKRSDEDIALLEIDRLIKNQLAFGKDLFTKKQLDIILPYQEKLTLSQAEKTLIEESITEVERQQQAEKRRIRNVRIAVSVFVAFLLGLSSITLWQWRSAELAKNNAVKAEEIAKKNEEDAFKQKEAADQAKQKALDEQKKAEQALADLKEQTSLTNQALNAKEAEEKKRKQAEELKKIQEEASTIQKELNIIEMMPVLEDQMKELNALFRSTVYEQNKNIIRQKIQALNR